jgi:hypothetical protein
MTMPHLMNCPHETAHWCLDCVATLGNENLVLKEREYSLEEKLAKVRDVLFGNSGVIPAVDAIAKKLDRATAADLDDAPFTLSPAQAHLWLRAQTAAYEHCLHALKSVSLKSTLESVLPQRPDVEQPHVAGSNA